jgi:ketosteroid isomerase-like protein
VTVHPDATYLARLYYTAIDDHGYDVLRDILDPNFVQQRGDVTLDGREEFVSFMRDDRPNKDTRHVVDRYIQSKSDDEIVVRGHLEDSDGDEMFVFLDRFRARDGKIAELKTFTRSSN